MGLQVYLRKKLENMGEESADSKAQDSIEGQESADSKSSLQI